MLMHQDTPINDAHKTKSKLADSFYTFYLLKQYKDADNVYQLSIKGDIDITGYIDSWIAMKVFSGANNISDFLVFFRNYVKRSGDYLDIIKNLNSEFYRLVDDEIQRIIYETEKERSSLDRRRHNSLESLEYIDQACRNGYLVKILDHNQVKKIDLLNLRDFFSRIEKKEKLNYLSSFSFKLLMRHVSQEQMIDFKDKGFLEYYASIDIYSLEDYYDCYDYKFGKTYFPRVNDLSEVEDIEEWDKRRQVAGLLPLRFSPLMLRKLNKVPKEENTDQARELSKELIEYLNAEFPNLGFLSSSTNH